MFINKASNDPEKSEGLTTSLPMNNHSTTDNYHYRHQLHARARLRHFLHPNGTRIHIADSPLEAEHLRARLPSTTTDPTLSEPFTVCLSGSPEHLSAVQESQSHHEAWREELRGQHGEVWEQFAEVQRELDVLSAELRRVAARGVQLEGHFGRFGYDAKIRSYDEDRDESPGHLSGMSSPRNGSTGGGGEDEPPPLKLFKVPVVRQYFHKGILWRASSSEEVRSFELFVDLLYVGIIAINGDATAEHPTGYSLLKFISESILEALENMTRKHYIANENVQSPSLSPGRSGTTWP